MRLSADNLTYISWDLFSLPWKIRNRFNELGYITTRQEGSHSGPHLKAWILLNSIKIVNKKVVAPIFFIATAKVKADFCPAFKISDGNRSTLSTAVANILPHPFLGSMELNKLHPVHCCTWTALVLFGLFFHLNLGDSTWSAGILVLRSVFSLVSVSQWLVGLQVRFSFWSMTFCLTPSGCTCFMRRGLKDEFLSPQISRWRTLMRHFISSAWSPENGIPSTPREKEKKYPLSVAPPLFCKPKDLFRGSRRKKCFLRLCPDIHLCFIPSEADSNRLFIDPTRQEEARPKLDWGWNGA